MAQDQRQAESDPQKPTNQNAAQAAGARVEFSFSSGLSSRLASLNISLAFSSYQSGLLYMLGRNPQGGLQIYQSAFPKPMGLHYSPEHGLILGTHAHIMQLVNVLEPNQRYKGKYDGCFVARTSYTTGQLDAHDVGVNEQGKPVFVNTRFNCLATVSSRHSFEPIWRPEFISALVNEDRCHLNGLAMDGHTPAYVTAVSRSDTIDGWRDRRSNGGVVIEVQSNRVICEGLSMPHSPRLHNGELWILNAGTGELGVVTRFEEGMGEFQPRVFCPGFLRGLAFCGRFAMVGLSKPRHKRFEGLALDQRLQDADSEPWCGVQIIDLQTATCVDWLRIDGAVSEIYDVAAMPDLVWPMSLAPTSAEAAGVITFPPEEPAS